MMYKFITIIAFTFFLNIDSLACINGESKELKDGTLLYEDDILIIPRGHSLNSNEKLSNALERIDSLYRKTNNIEYLSDIGVVYIYLKQYGKAIKLYLDIEKLSPNRYSTASNIGTAYELNGQNEEALKWIQKALKIDPNSHQGSEWIHLNILKAKIGGERFYNSKFLLNINFGNDSIPKSKHDNEKFNKLLDLLQSQLYFQLNERLTFVKPKDKIVAQLMFDFGNILFLQNSYSNAVETYKKAIEYGYSGELIEKRIKKSQSLIKVIEIEYVDIRGKNRQKIQFNIFMGVLLFLIIILVVVAISRKRNKS